MIPSYADLQPFLDAAPDALIVVDQRSRIVKINGAAERLFGYSRNELIGAPLHWLIPDRAREAHARHVANYHDMPRHRRMGRGLTLHALRKDGTEFPAEISLRPIEVDGDAFVVSAIRDVTEERAREAALRQSESKYRALVNLAPEAIVLADPNTGFIQDVNQAACDLFGRFRDELIGLHQRHLHPASMEEEAVREFKRFVQTIREGQSGTVAAFPVRRIGGSVGYADITGRMAEIDGDKVVFAFFRDVTERVRRDRELRIHRQRLQEAQRIAHLGHWVWDMEDGTLSWSDEVYRIFGYEPGAFEPTYERFLEMAHPDDRAKIEREVQKLSYQVEHRLVRPDGTVRVVEERGQISRWEDGEPAEMTGTVLDITERKELEVQLRQMQKIKMVGTLAGGIAHDFNNILHSVRAYVQMAEHDLPKEADEATYLRRADAGLERAEKLVRQLLTFSRQQGPERCEEVSVIDEIEEVIELARPTFPPEVEVRFDPLGAPRVLGDPDQFQQVIMNLVANAADAMAEIEPGARRVLDVRAHRVNVDEEWANRVMSLDPGAYVRISISDTGLGMDEETRERIFDPFFTTKDVGEGTGLGLSVVHGIVHSHDGVITVYSEPGEGTTFHIYLPALDEAEPRLSGGDGTDLDGAPAHLLFVDDNADIVEVETERLRQMGFNVTSCADPKDVLAEIRRRPDAFDAVVTDYVMPGMTGLELIEAVRRERPGLPFVLLSGFSAQLHEDDLHEAGIDAFLHKPVSLVELRKALSNLF